MDRLALARECTAAVQEHQQFMSWAEQELEPSHLPWVVSDGTQARAWVAAGCGEQWLEQTTPLLRNAANCPENQGDRWYHFAARIHVANPLARPDAAWAALRSMQTLVQEDREWPLFTVVCKSTSIQAIELAVASGEPGLLDDLVETERMAAWPQELASLPAPEQRLLCHNAGATLYRAKRYEVAASLLGHAAKISQVHPESHLWHAACLHTLDVQADAVVSLIHKAFANKPRHLWIRMAARAPELSAHPALLHHLEQAPGRA